MEYDLAIIGAGWAGITAARCAKDSGLKTVLIEKGLLGGTCLNRGCIPTKSFIFTGKVYSWLKKSELLGIKANASEIVFENLKTRTQTIIRQLQQGIAAMLQGVEVLYGEAEFLSQNLLRVGKSEIKASYIIIATGSEPQRLAGSLDFDGKRIISSDHLFALDKIPGKILIVGGGVIGCECAGLFANLGSKVTLVEKMPDILWGIDKEAAQRLQNSFKKRGMVVKTNCDVFSLSLEDYDLILVCVGRQPSINIGGLKELGIASEAGKIKVDKFLKTNLENIFAAGDCTGGPFLANYAAYQGKIATRNILHPQAMLEVSTLGLSNCIFTEPEIAFVGLTEEAARQKGISFKIHRFDFLGSAMARIMEEKEGFIKIISDSQTEQILGGLIFGPKATELIGIISLAVSSQIRLSQLRQVIFGHPTLSEAIGEIV